ncbi:uncharacterized protein TNCV_4440391 [Trichonephila clavipes]|nr:uncharacterized protein TNCV_4440391 [Trichonephila clavipes]
MQDGVISHIGRQVKALLDANLDDDLVISRHFLDTWPSHSLDLNPCDFRLWGFLKDRVYNGEIRLLFVLKPSIIRHKSDIPRKLLRATIENAIMHFQYAIDVIEAHIEHILLLNKC